MLTPKEIAYAVTKALDEKKGMDIKLLKIDRVSTLADYFLICTGTSNTHVKTLCDYAEYTLDFGLSKVVRHNYINKVYGS